MKGKLTIIMLMLVFLFEFSYAINGVLRIDAEAVMEGEDLYIGVKCRQAGNVTLKIFDERESLVFANYSFPCYTGSSAALQNIGELDPGVYKIKATLNASPPNNCSPCVLYKYTYVGKKVSFPIPEFNPLFALVIPFIIMALIKIKNQRFA